MYVACKGFLIHLLLFFIQDDDGADRCVA